MMTKSLEAAAYVRVFRVYVQGSGPVYRSDGTRADELRVVRTAIPTDLERLGIEGGDRLIPMDPPPFVLPHGLLWEGSPECERTLRPIRTDERHVGRLAAEDEPECYRILAAEWEQIAQAAGEFLARRAKASAAFLAAWGRSTDDWWRERDALVLEMGEAEQRARDECTAIFGDPDPAELRAHVESVRGHRPSEW